MGAAAQRLTPARIAAAGVLAATASGAPSTAWALLAGGDVLASTRAAGTLLPGRRERPGLAAGVVAHVVVSTFWTVVVATIARRRPLGPIGGAALGLGIAAFDLGVVGRRYPAIGALAPAPQVADHLAFGAILAWALRR